MKYAVLFVLVSLSGSFAQSSRQRIPPDVKLPNGQSWNDVIVKADHEKNVRDSKELAQLATEIQEDIERDDQFVLSLKTLRKVEEAEKLLKDLRSRMRKN